VNYLKALLPVKLLDIIEDLVEGADDAGLGTSQPVAVIL
jgi:hypothetical protein